MHEGKVYSVKCKNVISVNNMIRNNNRIRSCKKTFKIIFKYSKYTSEYTVN